MNLDKEEIVFAAEIINHLEITLGDNHFDLEHSLNTYCSYGKLVNAGINSWIQQNGLQGEGDCPTKIVFEFTINRNNTHSFKLYPNQLNLIKV